MLTPILRALSRSRLPTKTSQEAIIWAYRLILGREATLAEIEAHSQYTDLATLRRTFFESKEFRFLQRHLCGPSIRGMEPALQIEDKVDDETLRALLEAVQMCWEQFGEEEPHWSVLTAEQFKQKNLNNHNLTQFYQSGQENAELFLNIARRNGYLTKSLDEKTVLEYGCGVGRVTHALAQRFKQVYAYDISAPHLESARQFVTSLGLRNTEFVQVKHPLDFMHFPKVDALYTLIVLQHNPPPIIRVILSGLLDALVPGGLAYFQLQTYSEGYSFIARDYLRSVQRRREPQIEMHVLPQASVFEVVSAHNCQVLEVLDDPSTGYRAGTLSNTFLVRKRS